MDWQQDESAEGGQRHDTGSAAGRQRRSGAMACGRLSGRGGGGRRAHFESSQRGGASLQDAKGGCSLRRGIATTCARDQHRLGTARRRPAGAGGRGEDEDGTSIGEGIWADAKSSSGHGGEGGGEVDDELMLGGSEQQGHAALGRIRTGRRGPRISRVLQRPSRPGHSPFAAGLTTRCTQIQHLAACRYTSTAVPTHAAGYGHPMRPSQSAGGSLCCHVHLHALPEGAHFQGCIMMSQLLPVQHKMDQLSCPSSGRQDGSAGSAGSASNQFFVFSCSFTSRLSRHVQPKSPT